MHAAETTAIGSKHTATFAKLYGVNAEWLAAGVGDMLTVGKPDYSLRRLLAIYRSLDEDRRAILLDSARALRRRQRRKQSTT